jgi:hypothetical protein
MADSRKKYKPKLWIGAVNPLTNYGRAQRRFSHPSCRCGPFITQRP